MDQGTIGSGGVECGHSCTPCSDPLRQSTLHPAHTHKPFSFRQNSFYCTRNGIGNSAYIVYVTSLAILRTVAARGKLAGVTNDKLL